VIDIKEVSKWYGPFQVLNRCSTTVAKGEVVVVCGPSGSGKSTLIKCVNGLEPFTQGEVLVDGISVGAPGTNLPRLRRLLVEQICQGSGGPCRYSGRSMRAAHRGLGIRGGDFNALVEDLKKSLNKFGVPAREQGELLAILGPMKRDIVTRS